MLNLNIGALVSCHCAENSHTVKLGPRQMVVAWVDLLIQGLLGPSRFCVSLA